MTIIFIVPAPILAQTPQEENKKILESELKKLEEDLKNQEAYLAQQKLKTGTISGEIDRLQAEIDLKKKEIDLKTKLINQLSAEIRQKDKHIDALEAELSREKQSLAQILRKANELENYTFAEFFMTRKTVSDMFLDLDAFDTLQGELQDSFENIKNIQELTAEERASLQEKKDQEANNRYSIEQAKKTVERKEDEQQGFLQVSINREKTYEQIIAERKTQIANIRAALFQLAGGPITGGQISFGEAYDYAKVAEQKTGVRTALILGILRQESGGRRDSFGHNVGQCFLRNEATGDGVNSAGAFRDRVMKPDRDVQPFLRITKALGRDPYNTQISCPFTIGWGGAMGISQFIASTWAIFENDIKSAFGQVPDPWNPQHAITATALYLRDLGAGSQTYTAERDAACRYYSGRSCSDPAVSNVFYGNAVMQHASDIQQQIDFIEGR